MKIPQKHNIRSLITLLLLFVAALQLHAQNRTKVFGIIKDEQGTPIELASIRVMGQNALTFTNLKGEYTIWCESADSVRLVYSMIGYESRKRLLRSPADSIRLDVMLPSYDANNTLGTAVVTGQGRQTTTTQRIHKPDTKLAPSTTGNGVEEVIATQAGVSTHNELSSQYNVRGGSFDENCVYLNGIEVYRPMLVRSGQQEGLSIINSDMVESIGFSSGGFEARYGDKMSSVLDITYKRPEAFEASAQASMLGAGAYVGWGNKKVSLMSSVRYKTTRYLLGSTDTNGEYRPNFLDYQAFLSWRLIADGLSMCWQTCPTTTTTLHHTTAKLNLVPSMMPKPLKCISTEKKKTISAHFSVQLPSHVTLIPTRIWHYSSLPTAHKNTKPTTFKDNIG